MNLTGLKEKVKITKDKVIACANVVSVVAMCAFSSAGISALLEADSAAARNRYIMETTNPAGSSSDITESSMTDDTSSITTDGESSSSQAGSSVSSGSSVISDTSGSSETGSSSSETETSMTTAAQTTSAQTTAIAPSTVATTQTTIGESTYNAIVYATGVVNLRTGPGTSYEAIRQLHRGDQIDVVAVTTNGWYRTIRGNYVAADYTQSQPINTPSPTPKPATATPKPATPTPKPASGDRTLLGTYRITFYIPVNGTRTASGATAEMGTTVATNGDLPFGTKIYIENDPLGLDGVYTVQDRGVGSGVIDIYVNSMSDVPAYGVTTRKVYIIN